MGGGRESGKYDCVNFCSGAYCGTFTAADTGVIYKVYYGQPLSVKYVKSNVDLKLRTKHQPYSYLNYKNSNG